MIKFYLHFYCQSTREQEDGKSTSLNKFYKQERKPYQAFKYCDLN